MIERDGSPQEVYLRLPLCINLAVFILLLEYLVGIIHIGKCSKVEQSLCLTRFISYY